MLMVVIDFSAFQVPGVKWQALLVHVYRWDPIQDEEVSTPYIVFPTEVATNDAALFKIAFESVIEEVRSSFRFNQLFIWSDGGRKHFKQRYAMKYVMEMQRKLKVPITWNFFASHHGHGVCDADASHVKQAVRKAQRHRHIFIRTASQLMKIAHGVGRTLGRLVFPPSRKKPAAGALKNMTQYHQFTFDPAQNIVNGYEVSYNQSNNTQWSI